LIINLRVGLVAYFERSLSNGLAIERIERLKLAPLERKILREIEEV
jgi:hypothetical protein